MGKIWTSPQLVRDRIWWVLAPAYAAAIFVGIALIHGAWREALMALPILLLAHDAFRFPRARLAASAQSSHFAAPRLRAGETLKVALLLIAAYSAALLAGFAMMQGQWRMGLAAVPVVLLAHYSYRLHMGRITQDHRSAWEAAELNLRTIEALAMAIDAKDNTAQQHLHRVVMYAAAIGQEMGLPEPEMKALRAAALLHDIGKLAIPEYIISKPGRLTAEEFEKMKTHTVVGAAILERVQFPYPVAPIVRSHHERWDGSGYPDGLQGDAIPVGARILSVVDSFDALSSNRQYRRALSPADALATIRAASGALYDPRIVKILERIFPRLDALLRSTPLPAPLAAPRKVEKGDAPSAGLAVEQTKDTSSALYSIAQARQELQMLYELTQSLGSSLSVDETLQLLAAQLRKLVPCDALAVYLIRDGRLIPRLVEGVNAELLSRVKIAVGEGLSGWVAETGKTSFNGNPAVEPVHDPVAFAKLQSALSVPLDSSKGIIGVLTLYSVRAEGFTIDHRRILKTIGAKAGSTIRNALIHEATGRSAETDALTGLPNARALASRVEQESSRAARQNTPFTIFVVDLNSLKLINDTFGHLTGNKVLKAVATALRGCLREYDFVGRMGGDEFILLLPGMTPDGAAAKRLELLQAVAALGKDFPDAEVSISFGSASYPSDGCGIEQLMAIADRRMYRHKRDHYRVRAAGPPTPVEKVAAAL